MKPFFSVIIPTHNRSFFLEKILCYFSSISFSLGYELIIVDGFSTDSTPDLVFLFIHNRKLPITYLSSLESNSPAAKRNAGILNSNGDWLIFLDDDCTPVDHFLQDFYSSIIYHQSPFVCHLGKVCYPSALVYGSSYFRYRESRHLGSPQRQVSIDEIIPSHRIVTMNMAINRSLVLQSSSFFDQSYHFYGEDTKFGRTLLESGFIFRLANALVTHHDSVPNVLSWFSKLSSPSLLPGRDHLLTALYGEIFPGYILLCTNIFRSFPLIRRALRLFFMLLAQFIVNLLSLIDKCRLLYWPILFLLVERLLFLAFLFS